ncbi:MAG: type II toxin-antitoxin system Phd/YefM family antitoxin [Eubacterium sp.]|nr:type II toxin-antitoxin system Phd/YefM family antitoxin [Eubacterium sp.]
MLATTIQKAVKNFDKTCEKVVQNCEPIIITRKKDSNVVLVSQAEYDNLIENVYIRKSNANYTRLLESIEEAKAGKLTSLEIAEIDD